MVRLHLRGHAFLEGWLGQSPRSQLTILDLPDPEDAPFETGSLLLTAIRQATPEQLDGALAHALTHAWLGLNRRQPGSMKASLIS